MNCKSELSEEVEIDILIATVFLLMTQYASHQEKQLVGPITEHLEWLANHPDLVNSRFKKTCSRLAHQWRSGQWLNHIKKKNGSEKLFH